MRNVELIHMFDGFATFMLSPVSLHIGNVHAIASISAGLFFKNT